MKSTTYFAKIATQRLKSFCLREENQNPLACSPVSLLASCQLRNFLGEFTEKCFVVFDQSSCTIYLMWYRLLLFFENLLLSFLLWYDFKILDKTRHSLQRGWNPPFIINNPPPLPPHCWLPTHFMNFLQFCCKIQLFFIAIYFQAIKTNNSCSLHYISIKCDTKNCHSSLHLA